MRPDAAAVGGETDHQVIQTHVGNEAKQINQRVAERMMQVYALNQCRPAVLFARRDGFFLDRAVLQRPAVLRVVYHQTRFDRLILQGIDRILRLIKCLEIWNRLANQQRFFVPVLF